MANEDAAQDPKTPPELLAMLSTSPSETVRLLTAQNPSTPETALRHLAADENEEVRRAIRHRAQVSSGVLRLATLPRELLAQAGGAASADNAEVQPAPNAVLDNLTALPEALPVAPQSAVYPEPVVPAPPKRPGLFAWFWRLFGRSA